MASNKGRVSAVSYQGSPRPVRVQFANDIRNGINNINPPVATNLLHNGQQKKTGPLGGLKRERTLHNLRQRMVEASHNVLSSSDNVSSENETQSSGQDCDYEMTLVRKTEQQLGKKGGTQPHTKGQSNKHRASKAIGGLYSQVDERGLTPLHLAAESNQIRLIQDMATNGADVNVTSPVDRATPLHVTARYNFLDAAELLLQLGADVSKMIENGQTALHICCKRGYLNFVKLLVLKGKADVNSLDHDRTSPLHQAMSSGNMDICTFLAENGSNIRAQDVNCVTPLMQAAQYGFQDCVQFLLSIAPKAGILVEDYVSGKDNEGNTALHLAVGNRHINVARFLIDQGAPVNIKKSTNGFTPLHQAAIIGEEALVQMLIDKGAETEAEDSVQMTPLHRAALYNRVDVMVLLIKEGFFLDATDENNFTPLLCAAWKGQTQAGRSLLEHGANIRAIDKEMKTCLHWAVEEQHVDFTKMLFEDGHGGKDIIDLLDRKEQSALHYAAQVGNVQLVSLLIEYGAKVDLKDGQERTPLHTASEFGKLECVEVLYKTCPVPLNDDDIDDMTPLLLASQNGHHRVAQFLINVGADIESRNDDRCSSLALAVKNRAINVMTVLIANNANVNAVDKDLNTPLHFCAFAGHESAATLLLDSGAEVTRQNYHGKYPLDVAIENRHEGVAKAILSSDWQLAMNNIDSNGLTPMKRLIEVVPEAALLVMDQCVIRSHDDKNHPDLKITCDYQYLDPGPDDISFDKNNGNRYFALETMVEFKRERLLAHKLSQTLLATKWKQFAAILNYADFITYVVFVALLSVYLSENLRLAAFTERDRFGCQILLANTSFEQALSKRYAIFKNSEDDPYFRIRITDPTLVAIQFYIILFISVRIIHELFLLIKQRLRYAMKIENYCQWWMFITSLLSVVPPLMPPCDWNWGRGAMAIFMSWINFIFVLQRFDFFGLYVTMFFTTLKSLLKAMSVYVFFIIGFSLAFFVCFSNVNPGFRTEWTSFVTTFVMTLGEINKSDLLDTGESLHPFDRIANALLVIFLFLMPIVLINLTIGIAVGDIEEILDSSYLKRFGLQTDLILGKEKIFPRWLQRKLHIRKAEFRPNKRLPPWRRTIRSFLGVSNRKFLQKSKDKAVEDVTPSDVIQTVDRQETKMKALITMLHQQGDLLLRIADKNNIKVELEDPFGVVTSPREKARFFDEM